jgi:hypothetical protein
VRFIYCHFPSAIKPAAASRADDNHMLLAKNGRMSNLTTILTVSPPSINDVCKED